MLGPVCQRRVCKLDSQTALELFSKELLAYDSHVGQNDMFYYSLPYERNYELTNSIPLTQVSGNVIKFYQYRVNKPVVIFTDVVDTTAEEVAEDTEEELTDEFDENYDGEEMYDENGEPRELSEEEMAALLTADSEEEAVASDESAVDESASGEYSDDEEIYDKAPSGAPPEAWEAPEF